eukprot:m.458236 g.458236  ORF g.458236 m.458236 type:complete len:255 (+) comp21451_c0_seq1:2060-2824(+)
MCFFLSTSTNAKPCSIMATRRTGASVTRADSEDPEQMNENPESVDTYYSILETSEFEDAVIDTGMAITVLNLVFFFIFQFGTNDALLPLSTSFIFLPMHVVNHAFHHKKSVKKKAYRPFFFLAMTAIGAMQSLFYVARAGMDSGFLMLLMVSLIYPANNVTYMTEENLLLIAALGLFAGGTICIYIFMQEESQIHAVLPPSIKLLLQAINYFVALGAMIHITYAHLDSRQRVDRLQEAIAFNAREKGPPPQRRR